MRVGIKWIKEYKRLLSGTSEEALICLAILNNEAPSRFRIAFEAAKKNDFMEAIRIAHLIQVGRLKPAGSLYGLLGAYAQEKQEDQNGS